MFDGLRWVMMNIVVLIFFVIGVSICAETIRRIREK